MNKMFWISAFLIITRIVASADAEPHTQKLKIQMPSKVVRGFPVILRFIVSGEMQAPTASLFSKTAEMIVVFKDKNSGKSYKLVGYNQGEEITLTNEDGESRDARSSYRIYVKENETRAFILDLSSFVTRAKSNVFNKIEEGDYMVSIQFPFSKATSNQEPLHIILPTANENNVLQQTFGAGSTSSSWTRSLENAEYIQALNWNALSETAKSQLAFHRILAEKALVGNKNVDDALKFFPEFLKGEYACASLEILMLNGESEKFKFSETDFLKNYPEMKWALDAIHAMEQVFIRNPPPKD